MQIYFDELQKIEKLEFFDKFRTHIEDREKIDLTEKEIFDNLQRSNCITCYWGRLKKIGVDNLIFPHHAVELEQNNDPDRPVKVGGDNFSNVCGAYSTLYIPNARFSKCVEKITGQKLRFFNTEDSIMRADFLWVCNRREYAHPGDHYDDSHGARKLYIGNGFHRFVAYGLRIAENGFRPLEVHYVEADQ